MQGFNPTRRERIRANLCVAFIGLLILAAGWLDAQAQQPGEQSACPNMIELPPSGSGSFVPILSLMPDDTYCWDDQNNTGDVEPIGEPKDDFYVFYPSGFATLSNLCWVPSLCNPTGDAVHYWRFFGAVQQVTEGEPVGFLGFFPTQPIFVESRPGRLTLFHLNNTYIGHIDSIQVRGESNVKIVDSYTPRITLAPENLGGGQYGASPTARWQNTKDATWFCPEPPYCGAWNSELVNVGSGDRPPGVTLPRAVILSHPSDHVVTWGSAVLCDGTVEIHGPLQLYGTPQHAPVIETCLGRIKTVLCYREDTEECGNALGTHAVNPLAPYLQ